MNQPGLSGTEGIPPKLSIGRYEVSQDQAGGSQLAVVPGQQEPIPEDLDRALNDPAQGQDAAAMLAVLVDDASAATAKVERSESLLLAVREGRVGDFDMLNPEIDTLLGLLGRLDSQGRFAEELRLARTLNDLLALIGRWLALLRTLRALLGAAERAHDAAAQAWALHELGTISAAAGRTGAARDLLSQSSAIRRTIGDRTGLAASEQNLDVCRSPSGVTGASSARPDWPDPTQIAAGVGVAVVSLVVGFLVGRQVSEQSTNAVEVSAFTKYVDRGSGKPVIPVAADRPLIGPQNPEFGADVVGAVDEVLIVTRPADWSGESGLPTYAWYWCDAAGCQPEPGASSTQYKVAASDFGKGIRVEEKVANAKRTASVVAVSPEIFINIPAQTGDGSGPSVS